MPISLPIYLASMINGLRVSPTNQVILNQGIKLPNFETKHSPTFSISTIAHEVKNRIGTDIIPSPIPPDTESFSWRVQQSILKDYDDLAYTLIRMSLLESVAFIYTIQQDQTLLKYLKESDIKTVKENLNYLADYLGEINTIHQSQDENQSESIDMELLLSPLQNFVLDIRDMTVSFGYIQCQVDLLQNNIVNSLM